MSFPNLFRRIFAEGAFSAAFVPAYAKSLEADGEEKADEMAADAMATLAAVTIGLTVAAQLAMPWLMYLINWGYRDDVVKFKLAVTLTQITMPYLPCMAIVAHLSGVLNARGRFMASAAAPILLNVIMLIMVWPQHSSRSAAVGASWGVLLAGVAQAGLLAWAVSKTGAKVHWRLPRLSKEVKQLLLLALPGAFAASATQINVFVSQNLASLTPGNGARTWLATADRLYQLPLGLVGAAIGVALLPSLSRAVHRGDGSEAQSTTDRAIIFAMALTLPAAAALIAMPNFLIDGLFTRGEFKAFDAQQTALALFHYGWGTPAFVLNRILSPVFFARQDTKSPTRFAIISVAVNIVLGICLYFTIGFSGIAAATSAAAWLTVIQMAVALQRREVYRPSAEASQRLLRLLLCNVCLGAFLALIAHNRASLEAYLPHHLFAAIGAKEIAVALTCAAAALLYPLIVLIFGGLTVAEIRTVSRRG